MTENPQIRRRPVPPEDKERINRLINPVSALKMPKKVNLMLYGPPGSQKTVTACRIGRGERKVLLHEMNRDHQSLYKFPKLMERVDVVHYEAPVQLKILGDMAINGDLEEYETIVIDTLDGWSDYFLYEIATKIEYQGSRGNSNSRTIIQPRSGVEGASRFIAEHQLTATEQADYNMIRLNLQPIVRRLCASRLNVIFNCHARKTDKDKEDNWMHIRPDLPESAYKNTLADLDGLGYCRKEPDGRVQVRFNGGTAVDTKHRLEIFENASFPNTSKLVESINAFLKGELENVG